MRQNSLAAKLVLLVVSALTAAFLATAAVTVWIEVSQQARLETERLTQTARVIASVSGEAVSQQDRSGAFAAVRAIAQMPSLDYARVEGPSGEVLAETGAGARLLSDVRIESTQAPGLWRTLTTGSIEVRVPILYEGRAVGRLVLFAETPHLRGRILDAAAPAVLGALGALAVGLIVALRLARAISDPITALAARVRLIRRTQTYALVEDIQADGEVADLVAGVNDMMLGIQSRDAQLAEHVRTLEQTVERRTAELADAKRVAEAANAAKSDFLAVMSHEIRTPLNGILALGDLLDQGDLPPRERRYAQVIAGSGRALLNVINDILDFSKVEAGKLDLETVSFRPLEVVEGVADLFAARAAEKGLDLATYVDPTLEALVGDPARLRQVLANLLNNAIKFTTEGGVLIEVRREGPDVRFEVRDTGPGIPEDALPTLFEAFTQADQSTTRLHGGTGLGLAICDRLVRAMNGRWAVSSRLGVGSRFAFLAPLPVTEAASVLDMEGAEIGLGEIGPMTRVAVEAYMADFHGVGVDVPASAAVLVGDGEPARPMDVRLSSQPASAGPEDLSRPLARASLVAVLDALRKGRRPMRSLARAARKRALRYPGVRVLVVDDSAVNREVASETLERLGATVDIAVDGFEAVARAEPDHPFDLILMDGSMPGLDGFEAARRIRLGETQAGRPRTPIYALTAHVIGAAADAWRSAGMDGVVHKPFTLSDLAEVFAHHFADRAKREDAPVACGPSAAAATNEALFDAGVRAELMAMGAEGPDSFVARIERLYRDNAPARLEDLEAAADVGDLEAASRAAHALKSMSLSLGAKGVADAAGQLEHAARRGAPVSADVPVLRQVLEETLAAIGGGSADRGPAPVAEAFDAALADGRLGVVYQPLCDPRGGFARKVEALARWRTREGGWRSPATFIPELEAAGRLSDLTDFILARALEDAKAWPGVRVSVNAGADEFQSPDFAGRVQRALSVSGVTPDRLEIEVTETALLKIEQARAGLAGLSAVGVTVALDDFGAGFTSLHALRDLPFDTLKIDKSFVDDCCTDTRSAAIIHAVAGVGRALGMKVVCEGVETPAQADFLRVAGAHFLQGYLFHRPMEAATVSGLVEADVKDVA